VPYAQGGLLNLSDVIRLYSLALTQLRETFQKRVVGRFDDLEKVGSCVEERVEAVESMGQACRSLKVRLENLVEEVQEAVDNLKSER
jgi:NAD-dependent DNA ligase